MIPINFHTIVLRRKHSRTWRGTISDQRRDAAVSSFISRQEQDPCRSFRLLAGPSRDVITTRHLSPSLVFTAFAGDFFWCPVKTRNRARQLCLLSLSLSRSNHENSCIVRACTRILPNLLTSSYFCFIYRDYSYISFPSYFCFRGFFPPDYLSDFIIKKVYSGRDWIRTNWENQIFVY